MALRRNKKAVFFTIIAVFVVLLIVSIVSTRNMYTYRERSVSLSSRVRTMNNFIADFEKDLDREMFIGGYRALISMNAYVRQIQGFVPDFDTVFSEILINGTANGTAMNLMKQDAQGADIHSWLSRVNEEARKININAAMDVKKVYVVQASPWDVTVVVDAEITIEDNKGLASWTFNKTYTKDFSIAGLEDPLYTVGTSDRVTNLINVTPNLDFVRNSDNDTTVLEAHYLNSYYINSSLAPSFLMRFTGNLSPSPYGIESMVDLDDLKIQNIEALKRSVVDYIYFGNATTTDYCNITGMPAGFRIDNNQTRIAVYEIDRLHYSSC